MLLDIGYVRSDLIVKAISDWTKLVFYIQEELS